MRIWGDSNDDDNDNDHVLSVRGSVHTVWFDSIGFNNKLLFPCSSKAFSSITCMVSSGMTVTSVSKLGLLKRNKPSKD